MYKALTQTLTVNVEQKLFWALVTLCAVFAAAYVYFLSVSIYNVVLRKEMAMEISASHSRISNLEATYLEKKNSITLSMAEELGFRALEQSDRSYVALERGRNLTFNEE